MPRFSFYYIIISGILLLFLLLNFFLIHNPWLGLISGLLYLFFYGFCLGYLFFPKNPRLAGFFGPLLLLSCILAIGTIIYYFYRFDNTIFLAFTLLIPLTLGLLLQRHQIPAIASPVPTLRHLFSSSPSPRILLYTGCFFLFTFLCFLLLFIFRADIALRSPWEVVSHWFFIFFFAATAFLLLLLHRNGKITAKIALVVYIFLCLSIVLIVYRIGYGFDPFLHRAAEKIIDEQGFLLPKTPYYIGQYILVVFLSKLLAISISAIDKILLPLLTALYLPLIIILGMRSWLKIRGKETLLLGLAPLLLPFTSFIALTPQGLANFYVLLFIFSALFLWRNPDLNNQRTATFISLLFAFSIFLIHPLAGLTAIIFLCFLFCQCRKLTLLLTPLFSVAAPIGFAFFSLLTNNPVQFHLPSPNLILSLFQPLKFYYQNNFDFIFDFVYFYKFNLFLFFLIISAVGAWLYKKTFIAPLTAPKKSLATPLLLTFFVILINFIILRLFVIFPNLPAYEQQFYPLRFLETGFYFLLPFFLFAFYYGVLSFHRAPETKFIFFLIFALLLTASLYTAYPRVDAFTASKAYSVSNANIQAVHYIENDSQGADYIVLADQSVSAAALQEFGFKKYYQNNQIFYYPLPLGGSLDKLFLKMIYEGPKKEIMEEAMNLAGVQRAYYVVTPYWKRPQKMLDQIKTTSQEWTAIDPGPIHIFQWDKIKKNKSVS